MKNLENLFNTSFIYLFFIGAIFIQSCGQNCLDPKTVRERGEYVEQEKRISPDGNSWAKTESRLKIDGEFYTGDLCTRKGKIYESYTDGWITEGYSSSDGKYFELTTYVMGVKVSDTTWSFDDNGERYISYYSHYSSEGMGKNGDFLDMWGPDQIKEKYTYKNGKMVGKYERYHENGNRERIDNYDENGGHIGYTKLWSKEGTIERVALYENGSVKDEWNWMNSYAGIDMWLKSEENGKATFLDLDSDGNLNKGQALIPIIEGVHYFPDFTRDNLKDFDPAE
jgi:antitoxin component YwqK of YwqJK toxin-antitoxin module